MPNNDHDLRTLLAALPAIRARISEQRTKRMNRLYVGTYDDLHGQFRAETDLEKLLALVDTLIAERPPQPHEYTLDEVYQMVVKAVALDSPMYNGEGFEDMLGQLVILGWAERRTDEDDYVYYVPSASKAVGE